MAQSERSIEWKNIKYRTCHATRSIFDFQHIRNRVFPDSYHAQAAKGSCVKKSKTYLIFYNERKYFEEWWPISSVMLQRLNFSITSNQFYRCNWTLLSHRNIVAAIEKVQVLITWRYPGHISLAFKLKFTFFIFLLINGWSHRSLLLTGSTALTLDEVFLIKRRFRYFHADRIL